MQVGNVEAANRNAAFNILNSHDLYILSLDEIRVDRFLGSFLNLFNRVRKVDVMVFTRQFATMLEAKIAINDALKNLQTQTKNHYLKEAIYEIAEDIDAGLSLSQALERQNHIFSEFYVNLIQSAEVTGRVEEVMGFLADFLEKEIGLVGRVRNALIYPIFVLVLFLIVAGILVAFVFPQLAPIFEETSVEIPVMTRLLLNTGEFIAHWWVAILVVLIGLGAAMLQYFQSKEGKEIADQIGLRLPLIGPLFKKVYVARFSESISVLIKGGIPIAQAIEISGHAIGSSIYRESLHEIADQVRSGELLSASISKNETYFPPLVSQMVSIGEKTGKLEEMFDRISKFYTREIDAAVGNLVELIQPALMVILGVMVGVLFAAILIPIYNLAQAF